MFLWVLLLLFSVEYVLHPHEDALNIYLDPHPHSDTHTDEISPITALISLHLQIISSPVMCSQIKDKR